MTDRGEALRRFGRRVADARKSLDMDRAELARLVGVSRVGVGRIERGVTADVSMPLVQSLAAALDCTPEVLLDGTGYDPDDPVGWVPGGW